MEGLWIITEVSCKGGSGNPVTSFALVSILLEVKQY